MKQYLSVDSLVVGDVEDRDGFLGASLVVIKSNGEYWP